MAKTKVVFENEEYNGEELTEQEKTLLLNQLYGVLAAESSVLAALFKENEEKIIGAAEVAKDKFASPFKGLSASDTEFGLQLIRPNHVLRTTGATETNANDWSFTFTADADYWIGRDTNNTTAINIDRRLLVMPLGVAFTQGATPIVEELLLQVGPTTYPVIVLRNSWLADNPNGVRFTRIRPMIWIPKQTVLGQVYSILAGINELVLVGLSFAMGDLLRAQAPTTVQT